ncbi:hypothetical protein Tco_0530586 [Tanacetum coccineum]
MDTTKAQQKALDDALVAPENRLIIKKCNQRLRSTLKSNEPTIQVVLDVLKLTPFYNAFEVSTDVPKIYMQEFWATVTKHHFSLRFKLNGKSHTVNINNFRDMLKICHKLTSQKFEEPPFEEEILPLIRDLGHTGDIKVLSDVNINHMHQPWRSLAAIINKCLSGKTTGLERLLLSRAQLLWGMYYKKHIDYVYLFWEDFVFQVENKDSKKNNDMFYPREALLQASKGKRLKTSSKAAQFTKENQPATKSKAKGLTVLSEVALTKDEKMKLATKRSRIQTHSSYASGSGDGVDTLSKVPDEQLQKKSGTYEGAGDKPDIPDVPEYNSDSEEESWTFSDGDDDDDVNEESEESDAHDESDENESDDEGDDFVHPNLSTYTPDDQDKEEKESEKQEDNDVDGGEEYGDEEMLYGDLNLNHERIDAGMTEALKPKTRKTLM